MTLPVEGGQSAAGTEGQSATGATDTAPGAQGQGTQQDATQNVVSRAEFDQIRAQLSAADQKRQAAENKAKALEDAQLSEQDKQKRDLETAQKTIQEKDEAIKGLQLDLAFLKDNSYEWKNAQAALKLADTSGVEVADDGKTVKGLKEALEAVAKAHPYLLKDKDEDKGDQQQTLGVTGVGGQGAGNRGSDGSRANQEKRFPSLRGRVSS